MIHYLYVLKTYTHLVWMGLESGKLAELCHSWLLIALLKCVNAFFVFCKIKEVRSYKTDANCGLVKLKKVKIRIDIFK